MPTKQPPFPVRIMPQADVAVIGAGPAGLMAAEVISQAGYAVDVYDAMPSPGRKFLLAGIGGMNITHSEPCAEFVQRYGSRSDILTPLLDRFGPEALCQWIHGLGIDTFVGSSGRVFPAQMKAAPLLRAWLHRLRGRGVHLWARHRWLGWSEAGELVLQGPAGAILRPYHAVVLAMGGASWPRLGSDGSWVGLLQEKGVEIAPLRPANCGFELDWSPQLVERFAGAWLKPVALATCRSPANWRKGELVITEHGIEGSLVYAQAANIRDQQARQGHATIWLDLAPDRPLAQIITLLETPRGKDSLSNYLRKKLRFDGLRLALLREVLTPAEMVSPRVLAEHIKCLPLTIKGTRPLEEAISTAGGVCFESLDEQLMLRAIPGVFCAGEMLDWEAPTGGYLLTGCFSTGYAAGKGVVTWLTRRAPSGLNPNR